MRINKYLALATGYSRREIDRMIEENRIRINGELPTHGQDISDNDEIQVDGKAVQQVTDTTVLVLNKPVSYVCSRDGQGSKTIYELLPEKYARLKPVGRLDKDSSGLIVLTDDGDLAHQLTHPSFEKAKQYQIKLDRDLAVSDKNKIEQGIRLEDGLSKLGLAGSGKQWTVSMHEGRNRQIRRTFAALDYVVTKLHRTHFGEYALDSLAIGEHRIEAK